MSNFDLAALQHALDLLPQQFRGPGGVAGVVKDGEIVARRAWGYADLNARREMTAATRLPICSISKQMTCALLLDLFGAPEALEADLPALLPHLKGQMPSVAQLCHNQSGLRDYWAQTVLEGARPEGVFTREDGLALLAKNQSTHFTPGQHYSYSNGNFRLIAELIARASGRDFAELMEERIFHPAGMMSAKVNPDTAQPLDGVTGYEGNDELGFLPAPHGLYWFGDAGNWAALDDMLAWERWIDATREDPESLYNRLSAPVSFADGTPAVYGYGLRRDRFSGLEATGHGGALRGFSSFRLHIARERLSVYVNFNHESGASRAAWRLVEAALGCKIDPEPQAALGWDGLWMDDEQGLFIRTTSTPAGVKLNYQHTAQMLTPTSDSRAEFHGITLERGPEGLTMRREDENLSVTGRPVPRLDFADGTEIAGRYLASESGATLEIASRDGGTYIGCSGMLGTGPMERAYAIAPDLWSMPSRRSMDASPPGEWTVEITRDAAGKVAGLVISNWLARKNIYHRVAA
ncbi:D-aminopeptidase [Paracoccus aminophilus]|uniref:D-aminopeptidase n=1 Tax=Paracoccus aminophilus JCM 7686 TaxID=1367847 RepID=S5YZV0_PARAH|nr:D-aminopeptidase [Paracoccus aminophilus]AGT10736.1 D-aminopeptidase [Paracoccus aminophilus JCM 7686]